MTDAPTLSASLDAVRLYRYRLPLNPPVRWGGEAHTHRAGLLVAMESGGTVGWGEAAPLPGFSKETLAEAETALRPVAAAASAPVTFHRAEPFAVSVSLGEVQTCDLPPSAAFAVESAVADLFARHTRQSLAALLHPHARPAVSVNALVDAGPAEMGATARDCLAGGYRTLKVKVGRRDPRDEAKAVRAVREVMGEAGALRLDANQAWSWGEACAFAEALQGADIAYIEEPLADPSGLEDWYRETGCPVALDETARTMIPDAWTPHEGVEAVVLKPSLTGLRATLNWMRVAAERGGRVVCSSAYESGVGMRTLVALAAGAPTDEAAGLSPYGRLSADVFVRSLFQPGPQVDVAQVLAPRSVDESCLTRLT